MAGLVIDIRASVGDLLADELVLAHYADILVLSDLILALLGL